MYMYICIYVCIYMYISFLSLVLTLTPPKPDAHAADFNDPPAADALGRHLLVQVG